MRQSPSFDSTPASSWAGRVRPERPSSGPDRYRLAGRCPQLITRSLTQSQTPAADIVAVLAAAGLDAVLAQASEADRSRLLVRDGDRVLGSGHARGVLVARTRGRNLAARDLARPVPEPAATGTVSDAIEHLRRRRASLALVRDGEGELASLVSLDDDLLVRIMGPQTA
ncbi:hypothetical protein HHL19_19640 [Streptomyces sp. R302]|nr:hypothetical protein [Streptomyces sp. R301]NML80820.1 hypothetical protein [Streptomyces sp. R302]